MAELELIVDRGRSLMAITGFRLGVAARKHVAQLCLGQQQSKLCAVNHIAGA
jgi:hypothetical protein